MSSSFCCCLGGGVADGDYALSVDQRRRAAWRARFKTLLTSLQVQLGARPKGLHPRDQVFDGIMHLYAHEVREFCAAALHAEETAGASRDCQPPPFPHPRRRTLTK
jgi:hypothetical protein